MERGSSAFGSVFIRVRSCAFMTSMAIVTPRSSRTRGATGRRIWKSVPAPGPVVRIGSALRVAELAFERVRSDPDLVSCYYSGW